MHKIFILLSCAVLASCAGNNPLDGISVRQATMNDAPVSASSPLMGVAPGRASSGMMVSPLAQTRNAFWQ